jgi:[ribosomal protein S5]-alanine N-acetyltransferase
LEDAPRLFELGSDPEVTRWFSWGPYSVQAEAEAYLDRLSGQRAEGEQLDLAQDHHEDGVIGITGLSEFSRRDRRAIVGTWFGRRWWGTGANRESKALICHLGFEVLGLDRIGSYANVEHVRSQRALEGVGFRREGVLRGWHRHGDRLLDVLIVGMLRDDWERGPLRDVPVTVSGEPPPAFVLR